MKSEQKEFCLYITFKCNWSCDYCIMDTHNIKEPENILDLVNNIPLNSKGCITAGEPGMASPS